jgi:hypothetical protein
VGLRSPICWAWGASQSAIARRSATITTGIGSPSCLDQGGIGQVIGPVLKAPRRAVAVLLLLDVRVLAAQLGSMTCRWEIALA